MTQQLITQEWLAYAALVKERKDESFFSTLTLHEPELQGKTILFKIANRVQENYFDLNRQELLDFLRNKLQNFSLELKLEIQESVEKKMLYSDDERLKAMIAKNPEIAELVKRFGLDF